MEKIFYCPTQIITGIGVMKKLSQLCETFGEKAFIVMDPFFIGSDVEHEIKELLKDKTIHIFSHISPNPRDCDIDEGGGLCKNFQADFIVAIGGGSAIDSAKAMNVVACNGGSCWEYTKRKDEVTRNIENPLLPLIAIPTTAGTGSETTRYSVITHACNHSKGTLKSDAIFPMYALVDAQLMVSMPRKTSALTGIDAFAHAFESYISSQSNEISSMFALQAISLFIENIEEVCLHGENVEARNQMALCSTLGGLAITHAATTLPHAIGQALSGVCDAPHGGSIAVCMPQIIRWTLPVCTEKIATIACMFDSSLKNLSIKEQAENLPDILEALFKSIIKEPLTMSSYGLQETQIADVARLALRNYSGDISRHPKYANEEQLIAIIRECM